VVDGEREDAPVGKPDAPRFALLAVRPLHHDRGRPVHVIELRPRIRERALPGGPPVAGPLLRFGALDGLGEIGFGATELDAATAALVTRKPFLQRLFHRPLQWQTDGRAYGVRVRRDRVDAGDSLGFARDLIDEMKTGVAARTF